MSKRVVLAVVAAVLAAAMTPGVAWAGKTVPVVTLNPDNTHCPTEIGVTVEVTGFHGPRAYVQVEAATGSWADTQVFTLQEGDVARWYINSTGELINFYTRLVRKNGNPISDYQYHFTIYCA